MQDTPYGSARLALAARTTKRLTGADFEAASLLDAGLRLVWAARGGPHLHRDAQLPWLSRALWPLSDADATTRIYTTSIKQGAKLGIAAFTATATAMREVVTAAMPKGEVSAEVSARIPSSLTYLCAPCQAQHISGQLFQLAGLAGGLWVDPAGRGTTLAPIPGWNGPPSVAAGTDDLIRAYLRLHGPATVAQAAGFIGTKPSRLSPIWPNDLAPVLMEGREAWLPQEQVPALLQAQPPRLVRLLPPSDPFLQARDRDLVLPDSERRRAVWQASGAPGAVLVNGEIAGTWRARAAGKTRLDVAVAWFDKQPTTILAKVATEAERVAEVRALPDVRVSYDGD
ncbi:MAG: DNA glycosylase AlkZ-like family protein [Mycobacteriales bacterium]